MSPPGQDNKVLRMLALTVGGTALAYGQVAVDAVKPLIGGIVSSPPTPQSRDPRIQEFTNATKRELNVWHYAFSALLEPNAHPASGGRVDNEPLINEWDDIREELRRHLDATTQGFESLEWGLLYRTGTLRQELASNLRRNFEGLLSDTRQHLERLTTDLANINSVLERVHQEMAKAKKAKGLLDTLITIQTACDVAGNLANGFIQGSMAISAIPATARVLQHFDQSSKLIMAGFDMLAQYYAGDLTALSAGYAGVQDLRNDLETTLDAMRDAMDKMADYANERAQAEALYAIPIAGGK